MRALATVLIHFTATWAELICGPHRSEVLSAAEQLGAAVREVDVDADQDEARAYGVLQVPSVAVAGDHEHPPIPGAQPADRLVSQICKWLGQ
jgi:hypothetical protein